jgi:hypothetical protein
MNWPVCKEQEQNVPDVMTLAAMDSTRLFGPYSELVQVIDNTSDKTLWSVCSPHLITIPKLASSNNDYILKNESV